MANKMQFIISSYSMDINGKNIISVASTFLPPAGLPIVQNDFVLFTPYTSWTVPGGEWTVGTDQGGHTTYTYLFPNASIKLTPNIAGSNWSLIFSSTDTTDFGGKPAATEALAFTTANGNYGLATKTITYTA